MRQKIAAGNWKMNLSSSEARQLTYDICSKRIPKGVKVILGCPTPYLSVIHTLAGANSNVQVAAQNVHTADKGAFTGETSHRMLSSIGLNCVIVGHSERRQHFKESNKILKAKIDILVKNGFTVIFCCGEPLSIRKSKKHKTYVEKQLKESLFHLSSTELEKIIIAYEPIWAIGTGVTASPAQAQEMHKHIRGLIAKNYNKKAAEGTSILYGGSVKPKNAKELFSKKDVDGGLVGGASLTSESFNQIIRSF